MQAPTQAGLASAGGIVQGDADLETAIGGVVAQDPTMDKYSCTLRCNAASGALSDVTFSRDKVRVTPSKKDSVLDDIETWADTIPAFDEMQMGRTWISKTLPFLWYSLILSIICLSFVIPAPASIMAAEITGDKALYVYGIDTTTKYAYTARALCAYSTLITQERSTSLSASKARGLHKGVSFTCTATTTKPVPLCQSNPCCQNNNRHQLDAAKRTYSDAA